MWTIWTFDLDLPLVIARRDAILFERNVIFFFFSVQMCFLMFQLDHPIFSCMYSSSVHGGAKEEAAAVVVVVVGVEMEMRGNCVENEMPKYFLTLTDEGAEIARTIHSKRTIRIK
jgi:hypothetical protein